jgi:hypothetical protein
MRLPAKESDEAGDATSAGSSVHCWLLAANDRIDRRWVDVLCERSGQRGGWMHHERLLSA